MNFRRLALLRTAARTLRAHTVPLIHRQTVGEHTYNLLAILHSIMGPREISQQLFIAALHHDAAEAITGDVPATAKWKYPKLEEALKDTEELICQDHGLIKLDPKSFDAQILKYADYMELAMFGLEEMKMGNTRVEQMVFNVMRALESRKLTHITIEAGHLYEAVLMEFNKWRKNDNLK